MAIFEPLFFLSYDDDNCEYISMEDAAKAIKAGGWSLPCS
jgi:hypothetical protein